jgi:D-glycero-alpha-D-manno-heptose 1-phosphate guanylyltransferase
LETAIILCGGLGTRLRGVVNDKPKPMALVQDTPFIEILINQFAANGIEKFILSVSYRSKMIEQHFQNKFDHLELNFCKETTPLGTGGAIKLAFETFKLKSSVVLNGDSFLSFDNNEFRKLTSTQIGSLFITSVANSGRYGSIEIDEDGFIVRFEEKKTQANDLISAGIYKFYEEDVNIIPSGVKCSLEYEILPRLALNKRLRAIRVDKSFIDIGVPESYQQAQTFDFGHNLRAQASATNF